MKENYQTMKFEDWINTRLITGGLPYQVEDNYKIGDYHLLINVSDEYYHYISMEHCFKGIPYYWFPMNERRKDAGLNSIYAAMVILYHCEREHKKVFLHCHAGANRSIAVKSAYYFLRTGKHFQHQKGTFMNPLLAMCARGYLPPKAEMEKFLTLLGQKLNSGTMTGGTLEEIKISTIMNF